ncbi:hypothetical protein L6270_02510 [Candidatus Parcubacteria bacterium]|nr:hypothetical protein [Patescibacteria group bacterium]MBU4309530.1 hypothetical protein [Patescibacteria group bacterium]MBU4577236.1 hypothetical protein [Patescibacteria group bacterium]MCG2696882.1 hypothetical protein [Candidatus Parcubacteria bacterium]
MLDYLKKFNNLPQEIKDKFAAPNVLANVSEIEKRYNVSLATVIMRVLIKDIALVDLVKFMVFEFSMDARRAETLVDELNDRVFSVATDYLGLYKKEKPVDILEKVDVDDDRAMNLAREKMAIRTSSFFFSPDDEKEIQELTKKVAEHKVAEKERQENQEPQMRLQPQPQPMAKKMSDVMQKVDVNFSSEDLDSRFKGIVETYLRGVRNKIDIRQALIKDVKVGGLSLSEETINEIIAQIDEVKKRYDEPRLVPPLPSSRLMERDGIRPEIGARDAAYDFGNLKKEQEDKKAVVAKAAMGEKECATIPTAPATSEELLEPVKKPMPPIKSTFKSFSFIDDSSMKEEEVAPYSKFNQIASYDNDEMKKMAIGAKDDLLRSIGERAQQIKVSGAKEELVDGVAEEKVAEAKKSIPAQPIVQAQIENKKRMDDVKYMPKLVSPIEELRIMNLVNFRRLNAVPKEAKELIRAKINFLEEESYTKRLEGIKAWRQSPLNSLYITIGQEAISKEGGIRATINERQVAGQDFLTYEEFEAIMDLNKNLRF